MIDVLQCLFPCRHRNLTRPFTLAGRPGMGAKKTYVVCLDCGTQFSYDWERMRVAKPIVEPYGHGKLVDRTGQAGT